MTPERWQQVREVFEKAVVLEAPERSPYLEQACASDPELRREVESLLDYGNRAESGFLKQPAVDLLDSKARAERLDRVGRRIGVYQTVEEIGRGGMGEVYRAVRVDGQYTKEVAVKLVRVGLDTASIVERFRQERQILASLDHPNIGRLLDGGTTEEGIPYLVMELIEGTPIDEYCDGHALNIARRLQLFRQACAAVQYAHQRLVIHRDIKPSNIMVTKEGIPKLLDFGIAKILDPSREVEATVSRPMTPEYASPEQVRGEAITTATDVYSLGVVLYQLLTGRSPYLAKANSPHELAWAICEMEPGRPSTVISSAEGGGRQGQAAEDVSRPREGSPAKLRRRLAGDLDNIVLKALRKEPGRRYASVEQLAEDVRRHLEGLPVTARKDSFRYRAGKFSRRHKAGVLATAMAMIALITGVTLIVREARIAAANGHRAEKRFEDVRRLANSLMFEVHDSIAELPGSTPARKIIVQRSLEYLDSLAQEAGGDISLQRELASAYEKLGSVEGDMYGASLGDATGSVQSFRKALAIRQAVLRSPQHNSEDQIALAKTYQQLGRVQWMSLGATHEGLENMRKAVAIAESEGSIQPANLEVLEILARSYQYLGDIEGGTGLRGSTGHLRDAVEHHLKALPLLQQISDAAPSDPQKKYLVARVNIALGDDWVRAGDPAQAFTYYQQAEKVLALVAANVNNAIFRRGLAASHSRMGDALLMTRHPKEALAHYRKELELLQPLAAVDSKEIVVQEDAVTAEGDIGHALVEAGRVEEGKAALVRACSKTDAIVRRVNDTYSRTLLASTETLVGEALERAGDGRAARRHYERALDLYSAIAAADPADVEDAVNALINHNHLGGVHLKSGNANLAVDQFKKALAGAESLASSYPDNMGVLYALADAYAGLGDATTAQARAGNARAEPGLWRQAQGWYEKSLATWQKIPHPSPLSPNGFRAGDPQEVAGRAKIALQHTQL